MKTRQPFEAVGPGGPYRGAFVPRHGTWQVRDGAGHVLVTTRYKKNAMAFATGHAQWQRVLQRQRLPLDEEETH